MSIKEKLIKGIKSLRKSDDTDDKQVTSSFIYDVASDDMVLNYHDIVKTQDKMTRAKFPWLLDYKGNYEGKAWDFNPVTTRRLAQEDAFIQMLVTSISKEVASIDWYIEHEDNEEVAKEIKELLDRPNDENDFNEFIQEVMASLLEVGSVAVSKEFDSRFFTGDKLKVPGDDPENIKPLELRPLDPVTFTKGYNEDGVLERFFQFSRNSPTRNFGGSSGREKAIEFDRLEIAWTDLNPRVNRVYGLPPSLQVRKYIEFISKIVNQEYEFFSRGNLAPGALIFQGYDLKEIEDIQNKMREIKGSVGNIPGFPSKENQDIKFEDFSTNYEDLNVGDRLKFFAKVICAAFQVPMSVAGLESGDLNRATIYGERHNFEENTLRPYLNKIEKFINREIIQPHWGDDYEFSFNVGLTEEAKKSLSDRLIDEYKAGVISREEIREQLQYGEADDEDTFIDPQNTSEPNDVYLELSEKDRTSKPFGDWSDFNHCVDDMMEEGYSEEEAKKVCGMLQEELKEDE